MKRYGKYKDSGISWLGEIPENWKVVRYKDIANIVRGGSPRPAGDPRFYGGKIPFLKVGDLTKNESPFIKEYTYTITDEGLSNTRLVKEKTLLLTNSGATLGVPKITTFSTTFNDGVAAFLGIKKADNLYLYFLLKSKTLWFLNMASLGQGQPNLNTEIVGNTFLSIPPLQEQIVIAQYLDTKTQKIDRKVKLLEQKIQYYKELRKSIINKAVTKGLDDKVELKESGISQIGKIPNYWTVKRIKDIFLAYTGNSISDKNSFEVKEEGRRYYISTKDINFNSGKIEYDNGVYIPKNDTSFKIGKKKSILICLEGANAGKKVGFIEKDVCFVNKLCCLKAKESKFENKFYYYFILSESFRNQFFSFLNGMIGGVSINALKKLNIVVPLKEEQIQIAQFLDEKTSIIDRIIKNIEKQVTTLKELRKSLINDVVTGKIKVTND